VKINIGFTLMSFRGNIHIARTSIHILGMIMIFFKYFIKLFFIFILTSSSLGQETAEQAWARLTSNNKYEPFVKNNPELPNVLIYGDSISMGYTPTVRIELKNKVNVYRLHINGNRSSLFIRYMKNLEKTMRNKALKGHWNFEWDVIQFNVGLHDLRYIKEKSGRQANALKPYEKNLREILKYLKHITPKAKIIFATTTPVPENAPVRIAGDSVKYNKVALKVMKENGSIVINDLYTLTKANQKKWMQSPGNVHFNKTGCIAQGKATAAVILKQLPIKCKNKID
jgi:GDSL-like Lipase/Acylhydrolase family